MRPKGRPFGIIFWPVHQASGHAAELILKAFHARKGKSETQIRAYKHNLRRLLDDAMSAGLRLHRAHYDSLMLLDDIHAELWARYVKPHAAPCP